MAEPTDADPVPFHPLPGYTYVYILQSTIDPDQFYCGRAEDLLERLDRHNRGVVRHTRRFRPWFIRTTVMFREKQLAVLFERYLKTASGRAFAQKRL